MDLFPAIDLRDGQCVRLLQGDYDRQIDYNDDPLAQAKLFEQQGAKWLHVVDLDGARQGLQSNRSVIERIVKNTSLRVQVGGGVRDEASAAALLTIGVKRVIVGTRALEDLPWFEKFVHNDQFAGRVVLGLDARNGRLQTRGWRQEATGPTALQLAQQVSDWPLAAIVYTDISCDGMLTGPNIQATNDLAHACRVGVIASGGVGSLKDLVQLAPLPLAGVIVGRALYENQFNLVEALHVLKAESSHES